MQSTAQNTKEIIYVGTYSERGSKGIYVFEFDREAVKLTEIQALTDREHPTYLDIQVPDISSSTQTAIWLFLSRN